MEIHHATGLQGEGAGEARPPPPPPLLSHEKSLPTPLPPSQRSRGAGKAVTATGGKVLSLNNHPGKLSSTDLTGLNWGSGLQPSIEDFFTVTGDDSWCWECGSPQLLLQQASWSIYGSARSGGCIHWEHPGDSHWRSSTQCVIKAGTLQREPPCLLSSTCKFRVSVYSVATAPHVLTTNAATESSLPDSTWHRTVKHK